MNQNEQTHQQRKKLEERMGGNKRSMLCLKGFSFPLFFFIAFEKRLCRIFDVFEFSEITTLLQRAYVSIILCFYYMGPLCRVACAEYACVLLNVVCASVM